MRDVNLIPARRRDAKRWRAHIRWCAVGCSAYAVLATAVAGLAWNAWAGEDPAIRQETAHIDEEIHRNQQELTQASAKLSADQQMLSATRQIAGQPDWSLLLTLLAHKTDDQMVLRSCQFRPASDVAGEAKATDNHAAGGLLIIITGVARSPQGAQQYVLRLEKTGLFDRVTLVETRREPFLNGEAAGFRVDCVLSASDHPGRATEGKDNR